MKLKKIISVFLAIVMLASAMPLSSLTVIAAESTEASKTDGSNSTLTLSQQIEKEMAAREAITKKREGMNADSEAAVYVDGVLKFQGAFRDAWNKTHSYAPKIKDDYTSAEINALPVVEFVLNKDITYSSNVTKLGNFGRGALRVSQKKITIDLNGHILRRTRTTDTGKYLDSVMWFDDDAIVTIMDSNPTVEHKGKIKDHLWVPDDNGDVIIKGGIICGGYATQKYGGGIYMLDGATLYMTGGTLAGNQATSGSAIYIHDNCTVDMTEGTSQICYNACSGSIWDGGAVYLSGAWPLLNGGYIHHNWSEDYGAGILADDHHFTIRNAVVYANEAVEEGGGIYIDHERASSSLIEKCRIVANYSGERGGGVYLYSHLDEVIMRDCIVENNCSKEHGGGICVGDYDGVDLTIDGTMIVRNNFKSSKDKMATATDKSNLYLQGDEDLIIGNITSDSEVWIRTGTSAKDHNGIEHPITENRTVVVPKCFFSDNTDYHVAYYTENPNHSTFHRYYLKKGKNTTVYPDIKTLSSAEPEVIDTTFSVTSGDKTVSFPIIRGIFEYNLMSTSDYYSASPFYYSDGYFFNDPTEYNRHLATMSINMAVAAFGRSTDAVGTNKYANHFANVKQLMSDIGCPDENFFANSDYQKRPDFVGEDDRLSSIAVAMSHKEISMNGEEYTLVPIAIRGGSYEVEWASNVTLGTSGEAKGFADAANQVTKHVNQYIADYGLKEKVDSGKLKFWVVGYSRAGATANLTSKRLVDAYVGKGNQVFGYTFEAPMGGIAVPKKEQNDINNNGEYLTIHNTVNENDFVTLVAPKEMGFIRYGVDHLIGADYNNKCGINSAKYIEQRDKMTAQLLAINPDFYFDDYWNAADVNIVSSNLPDWLFMFRNDLIQEATSSMVGIDGEARDPYTFLRWFFLRVQEDGLDTSDKSKFREYYSSKQFLKNAGWNAGSSDDWKNRLLPYNDKNHFFGNSEMSVETAVQTLMKIMYTLTAEEKDELIEIVMHNVGKMGKTTMIDKYQELILFFNIHTVDWCADGIDDLLHDLLDPNEKGSVWEVLTKEQGEALAEALPVLIYFLCCYASEDYNETVDDSGMWGVGTFVFNMSRLMSNHYQEVSVAWVRSYDDYYSKDLQAYKLDTSAITYENPTDKYKASNNLLTLSAQAGSSVFYSIDNGNSWKLYTKPVAFEQEPEKIQYFSIYHGVKSKVETVNMNKWPGALFGEGNIWLLIVGLLVIASGAAAAVIVTRRKKKSIQ